MRAVLSADAWQYGFASRASLVESAAVACGAITCPDIMLVTEVLAADCGNNGSAVASVSGGTEPYTYTWSNGSTSAMLSGVSSGNYVLTVVDAADCEQTASIFIPTETLVLDISVTDESMPGANDGVISVNNVVGGMSPYFYQWSNDENTATVTNLSAGDYSVTITSENGCSVSETIMVNTTMACPGFVVDYIAQPASCAGSCDGAIELFLPNPDYMVSWSANVPAGEPANLCSDIYLATITDPNGCIEILEIFVEEPTALEVGIDYTVEPLCAGDESGSIAVFAEGGTGEHTFFWSNGNTGSGAVLTSLPAGGYSVTIYDENECSAEVSVNLEEPSPIEIISIIVTDETTVGANDGTASVEVTGGAGAYVYAWDNGATTSSIGNLAAGAYSVTVYDANQCSRTESVIINVGDVDCTAFNIELFTTHIACFGEQTGVVETEVFNGVAPYDYAWSNGENTSAVDGLGAGIYVVTVTDAQGCEIIDEIFVEEPSGIMIDLNTTDVSVFGGNDGAASAVVSGGAAPYMFNWSNGATGAEIANLAPGTYELEVTDMNGCTQVVVAEILDGNADCVSFAVSSTVQDNDCFGGMDGSISLTVSGAFGNVIYNWSNGETGASIDNLATGVYSVTIIDDIDCTLISEFIITDGPMFVVQINSSNGSCSELGFASATVIGGEDPVVFQWNTGADGVVINNLENGLYTVMATDANGCTAINEVEIENTPPFETFVDTENVSCAGADDGAVFIGIAGGVEPIVFDWSNGLTGAEQENLPAGNYSIVIMDATGCSEMLQISITEPSPLTLEFSVTPSDGGNADGTAQAIASGGNNPYTYDWSNDFSGIFNEGLLPGEYACTVTDSNGCTAASSFEIMITGIEDLLNISSLQIFPNPANDFIFVKSMLYNTHEVQLDVLDVLGRKLISVTRHTASIDEMLHLENLAQGTYFINIKIDDKQLVRKFIVMD